MPVFEGKPSLACVSLIVDLQHMLYQQGVTLNWDNNHGEVQKKLKHEYFDDGYLRNFSFGRQDPHLVESIHVQMAAI